MSENSTEAVARDSSCWACMSIAPISDSMMVRLGEGSEASLCAAHQVELAAVLLQFEGVQLCKQCNTFSDSYVSGFCSPQCSRSFFAEGKSH